MKKQIVALSLIIACKQVNAQHEGVKIAPINQEYDAFSQRLSPKVIKDNLIYIEGYDKEVDDNIKWALTKFWKFSKFSSVQMGKGDKLTKNTNYVQVKDVEPGNSTGQDVYNTHWEVQNTVYGDNHGGWYNFDNIRTKKQPDVIIGADKTTSAIACKALMFAMNFCSENNNFHKADGDWIDAHGRYSTKHDEEDKLRTQFKERLKTSTVLIPKELIDNGFPESALKTKNVKYKIETSAQIAARVKAGKDVKNYSYFLIGPEPGGGFRVYIIDIENGDLLYYQWAQLEVIRLREFNKDPLAENNTVPKLLEDINKPYEAVRKVGH